MAQKARNRKGSKARARAKRQRQVRQRQPRASSGSARTQPGRFPGGPLSEYERIVLRTRHKGVCAIDPKLRLASDYTGPGGSYSHWYDLYQWDHEKGDWGLTPKDRLAALHREQREADARDSASYESRRWVYNRQERYRIDYLGSPYAVVRSEGRRWEIAYFPGEANRKLADRGLPCKGELSTRRVGDREIVDGQGGRVILQSTRKRGDREISVPHAAESSRIVQRILEKLIARGRDPAVWDIDAARAARIGRPRRPLRDDAPTLEDRLGEHFNVFDNRALFDCEWRTTVAHFDKDAPPGQLEMLAAF